MSNMFSGCLKFNGELSYKGTPWDVSKVTDMKFMFYNCKELNQSFDWDVSNVKNTRAMFSNCLKFNGELTYKGNPWDVSKVTDMTLMFEKCRLFRQDLSNWNVRRVIHRLGAFAQCPCVQPRFLDLKKRLEISNGNVHEIIMKKYADEKEGLPVELHRLGYSKGGKRARKTRRKSRKLYKKSTKANLKN